MAEYTNNYAWPPIGAPLNIPRDDHWSNFDSSVNALSFGFVATAILISMFLVMAIFERFLRPNSPVGSPSGQRRHHVDIESQAGYNGKLSLASPKSLQSSPGNQPRAGVLRRTYPAEIPVYTSGVSVLMPGDEIPTYIAHPAPMPCPSERISWPSHQQDSFC